MRSWSVNSVSQSMETYVVMKSPLFIEITSIMSLERLVDRVCFEGGEAIGSSLVGGGVLGRIVQRKFIS
jgi:hypothetical protein